MRVREKKYKKETREEGNPIDKKNNTWREDENVMVTLVLHDWEREKKSKFIKRSKAGEKRKS